MAEARRVLVVEDDGLIRALVAEVLQGAGHTVDGVSTGLDALQHLARAMPDVVLLDVMLPGMDGFEVLREIRRLPEPHPTVWLMSAHLAMPSSSAALLGAAGFLAKPFADLTEVLRAVER